MEYLPVSLDLRGRRVVVIGAGEVASRKIELLRRAGAQLVVIAREALPELAALLGERLQRRDYAPGDLATAAFVVAATDDAGLNARVAEEARTLGIWVNVVDDRELSSAIMPAIVDRGALTVAISSSGASPVLATRLRNQIEALLPESLGALVLRARSWRERVAARLPAGPQRRSFWQKFFDAPPPAERGVEQALDEFTAGLPATGTVYLTGAGPGNPDFLTLRALQVLGTADIVFHDRLVSAAVLDRARRDAERVDVGKRGYGPGSEQQQINAALIAAARAGKTVVRLKGGDPFVFGRGGEELLALRAAGIPVEVIPGITAALGCAAGAGIPLTHRSIARAVTLMTARAGSDHVDPLTLPAAERTFAIYMGLAELPALAGRFMRGGLPPSTPAALIVRGSWPDQSVIRTDLAALGAGAVKVEGEGPAMLIVGAVAGELPA
jgi:uroporphyrin-III C-methyltransferase/precorrin-2 dehydrogenase/sirohydrochlorin ferrochelatase